MISKKWVLTILGMTLVFPLCWFRRVEKLKFTSFISLSCLLWTVFVVFYEWLILPNDTKWKHLVEANYFSVDWKMFVSLGALSVSYTAQHIFVQIYQELPQRSVQKAKVVSISTTLFAFTIYFLFSSTGYLHFLSSTKGNILDNFGGGGMGVGGEEEGEEEGEGDTLSSLTLESFCAFRFFFPLLLSASFVESQSFLSSSLPPPSPISLPSLLPSF